MSENLKNDGLCGGFVFKADSKPGSSPDSDGDTIDPRLIHRSTGPDADVMEWLPSTKEKWTSKVHSIRYGVECNKCGHFEDYKTRYCSTCGGLFLGEVPQFAKKTIHIWRRSNVKN